MNNLQSQQLLQNISALLDNARKRVVVAVNQTMVLTYYEIGRMIVEDEQHGESRAEYGKAVLKELSLHLTEKFGKGFSQRNLEQMRQFYLSYSIPQTLSAESENEDHQKRQTLSDLFEIRKSLPAKFNLSWSHYLKLMRIKVKHWFNIRYRKITNRFLQVNILQYYQAKKILLTF